MMWYRTWRVKYIVIWCGTGYEELNTLWYGVVQNMES